MIFRRRDFYQCCRLRKRSQRVVIIEHESRMFNETSFVGLGDRSAECQAIKDNCDRRFPVDPNANWSESDPNWDCMKAGGYPSKCMDNRSYENPGSSTYVWDTLTNPQNPNTVWQWPDFVKNIADGMGLAPAVLVGMSAALLLSLVLLKR